MFVCFLSQAKGIYERNALYQIEIKYKIHYQIKRGETQHYNDADSIDTTFMRKWKER